MQSVAEEPQKLPLAQMGGGVSCNHAIKEGGEGRKPKAHFCSQGGSGCRVVEGGKITHAILEHPQICYHPSPSPY